MADLHINIDRLSRRIEELGTHGALPGGGVCRLALTEADRAGRDLVVSWMRELGLQVTIDQIGNVIGIRPGRDGSVDRPVLMGSHIDTVATGGLYDGNLGVLAGLEVIQVLAENEVEHDSPVAVGFFTNEEGARFAPDMMGSGASQGALDLETCLAAVGIDGTTVAEDLERIGYAGEAPCGSWRASAYFELHIEQGPVLATGGFAIGAVTGVQGISWTEWAFTGQSNHAGTTPMGMRSDAGLVAARVACFVRDLANQMGGAQVATVGSMTVSPNLINVVPNHVTMTVDLRNTEEALLCQAEKATRSFILEAAKKEGVRVTERRLARFEPVQFDGAMLDLIESSAREMGLSVRRLPSGAGHDAQMFAPHCPTAMIFVPSEGGISHNIEEFTRREDVQAGADLLLRVVLDRIRG